MFDLFQAKKVKMRLFILLLMFGLSQARFAEPGHNFKFARKPFI